MEDTPHRFIIIISISSMSISVHDGLAFWFFFSMWSFFFSFSTLFPFLSLFVPDSPPTSRNFFSLSNGELIENRDLISAMLCLLCSKLYVVNCM